MNSDHKSTDESLARIALASEEAFMVQLKTLEDFLAANNHTLESALEFVYSNRDKNQEINEKAQEVSRRTRELYQFRDFLSNQRNGSVPQAQTTLAPSRMRRLARV